MMGADQSVPGATTVYNQFGVAIAAVPNPRPFVYTASDIVMAVDSRQAAALLSRAPLGPVVVEGCCPAVGSAQVDVISRRADEVRLTVNADSPATIVVEQSFQPGWEADVDGRPDTILPADVLYQAVTVPTGHHAVTLIYRPDSARMGAVLSAIGLAALVILAAVSVARRRRTRSR